MSQQTASTNSERRHMSSGGVEAGEKMLGISGPLVEVANASLATPTKIQPRAPRVIRLKGKAVSQHYVPSINNEWRSPQRLISDGRIAPYGQFVKFSLPDLARRYRRRILVFAPINILLSWTIQNRIAAGLAEVIPGPFYEGFNLGTRGSEQRSMHSHPSSKSNCAPHFVAFLTHLGHGAVTPDHRHNAFVEIFKWFPWCARNVSQDILGAPLAGLFGHRGKLGQRLAVFPADVREVPQGVNVGKARHREIWLNINASAMTRLDSHLVRQRRSL